MKNFYDLFVHELRDIYAAEKEIEKTLPEMAKAAHLPKLKEAFRTHHEETIQQVKRLEQIAQELEINLKNCHCDAIDGILKEGKKLIKSDFPSDIRDAALIISAQRVEHYEIAVYGSLKSFASHLGFERTFDLLDETLKEEGHADKKLTEIANGTLFTTGVNEKAVNRK